MPKHNNLYLLNYYYLMWEAHIRCKTIRHHYREISGKTRQIHKMTHANGLIIIDILYGNWLIINNIRKN